MLATHLLLPLFAVFGLTELPSPTWFLTAGAALGGLVTVVRYHHRLRDLRLGQAYLAEGT